MTAPCARSGRRFSQPQGCACCGAGSGWPYGAGPTGAITALALATLPLPPEEPGPGGSDRNAEAPPAVLGERRLLRRSLMAS